MRFSGTTALITGSASGIGQAAAEAFAREGANVSIVDIDERQGEATARRINTSGGSALYINASVADGDAVQRAAAETTAAFGKIDFLFNNAGIEFIAPLMETSEQDWDAIIDTNLKGTFLMTRAVLGGMIKEGFGVIVNNASDAGLRGIRVNASYSTSKAGVIHLTRSVALDYADKGVRCNCICPGCIKTLLCERFNEAVGARHGISGEEALDQFVQANIPMKRVGMPQEVASVVLFLCSEDARYINGAIIPIDGGLTAGM